MKVRHLSARSREDDLRAFLTMTSHDLRTPLTTVAVHLQMLRDDRPGPRHDRDLDAMERAVRRMTSLVEGLLAQAVADRSDLTPRPVPLAGMVAGIIAERLTTDDGSRVTVTGPLPTVPADPDLLRHVLDNLIGNALKYTHEGTPARVEVSARHLPGGAVRVEVADRGIGVPPHDRARVFDDFHRSATGAHHQGTGVGLAICRRIVERHGGTIGVTGNPGGGSRFWFTLPGGDGGPRR